MAKHRIAVSFDFANGEWLAECSTGHRSSAHALQPERAIASVCANAGISRDECDVTVTRYPRNMLNAGMREHEGMFGV